MRNPHQRPLIRPPLRTLYTNQPIIRALPTLHNPMRSMKRTPQARIRRRAIGKIPHAFHVRSLGVEILNHVFPRQLRERTRIDMNPGQELVEMRQVIRPYLLETIIRERTPPMRRRDRRQAQNFHIVGTEARDHVARVETAHGVRDYVYALPAGFGGDVGAEFGGAFLDGARGGHGGGYYFDAVCEHGFGDAAPVVDAWEEGTGEAELVKAHETVGEDDGVFGSC